MALIPGVDSYASLAEIEKYIADYYLSTDPLKASWDSLSTTDKETLLRAACLAMESLVLTGRKLSSSQPLQFPRHLDLTYEYGPYQRDWQDIDFSYVDYVGEELASAVIPDKVKYAQAEVAMALSKTDTTELMARESLQQQGVTSYSIGDLSETYGKIGSSNNRRFLNARARNLLSTWLCGGYKVI